VIRKLDRKETAQIQVSTTAFTMFTTTLSKPNHTWWLCSRYVIII